MIELIVVLVVVGFAVWAIGLIPMDARMLMFIRGIAILCALIWVLQWFGLVDFNRRGRSSLPAQGATAAEALYRPGWETCPCQVALLEPSDR